MISQLNLIMVPKGNEYERPKIIKENDDACNITYYSIDGPEQSPMIYQHILNL